MFGKSPFVPSNNTKTCPPFKNEEGCSRTAFKKTFLQTFQSQGVLHSTILCQCSSIQFAFTAGRHQNICLGAAGAAATEGQLDKCFVLGFCYVTKHIRTASFSEFPDSNDISNHIFSILTFRDPSLMDQMWASDCCSLFPSALPSGLCTCCSFLKAQIYKVAIKYICIC